ncbi:MAG: hypothetical protein QNJ70_27385 [Xenococcaceae cyanobacterium MO_207.B15]|nr:hypothetical protein [Xenococcaceae cyanobacterium MO_207.B15]MDJ0745608.1 hypothetical protein [Xenococcaceae cyanobacterium MO_167.B27]
MSNTRREEQKFNNSLPKLPHFKLAPLTSCLARELLFQWCKQPIGESVSAADIIEDLGVKHSDKNSKIIAFLEKTAKNTTLTSGLLLKIENLQARQTSPQLTYSKTELETAANTIEKWFQSPGVPHFSTSLMQLSAKVKFLRSHTVNKIRYYLTRLWQKAGTKPLLNLLEELEYSLQDAAEEYYRVKQKYLFKQNSARRAYNKLSSKLDTDKKNRIENWESAWKAIKLTYQFRVKAQIYHFAHQLVTQLVEQIKMYCKSLTSTNKLLEDLQVWFAEQNPLQPALLPSLLVHIANEVDFYELRNQFEKQTGHFLNQWGTASSISQELLKEKIVTFVRPIAIKIYTKSCRQALALSS